MEKELLRRRLETLKNDPVAWVRAVEGYDPDPWQRQLLESTGRTLMLCSRQMGKSTAASWVAARGAIYTPGSLTLILSGDAERQSRETYEKVYHLVGQCGVARERDRAGEMVLENGSRVVALPATEATTRGYSNPALVLFDEAALMSDAVYSALRPMLIRGGRAIAMSTPHGRRGWFYRLWTNGDDRWLRITAKAADSRRISPRELEAARQDMGEHWFRQEFGLEFVEAVDSVFSADLIDKALRMGNTIELLEAS